METDVDPWAAYARLQTKLMTETSVDDRAWGLEAGLGQALRSAERQGLGHGGEDAMRTSRSESRRERHRARLRRIHFTVDRVASDPIGVVVARRELIAIRTQVSETDWIVLEAIALGYDYAELAASRGMSVGTLRVRVSRVRRELEATVRDNAVLAA